MGTEGVLSTARRHGSCVFVVDPACGNCSRGEAISNFEFRKKAGQEFLRYVIAGIERLTAFAAEHSFVECALFIVGYSQTLTFFVPGASMLAAFSPLLAKSVNSSVVAHASRADAFVLSDAVSFVCKHQMRNKLRRRTDLFLFATAPATTREISMFLQGSGADDEREYLRLLEDCSVFEEARADMVLSGTSLFWIDSSTRRELIVPVHDFNTRAYLAFENWLISTEFAKAVMYLHTLVFDRSILPFGAGIEFLGSFKDKNAASSVPGRLSAFPDQLVNDSQSVLSVDYCSASITQVGNPSPTFDAMLLHCRAIFPLGQSFESGLLGSPHDSRPGVCIRPSSSNIHSSSDSSGLFAGLMIGLVETECVLVVDITGIRNESLSAVGTAFLQPLAPLLGSLVWMDGDLSVLDDTLRTRTKTGVSATRVCFDTGQCVGRFSASIFESFIGTGLADKDAVEETLPVVKGMMDSPLHVSTQLPPCCVAEALATGARSEPASFESVVEIKQLHSPVQRSVAQPSEERSPSIADRDPGRLRLLESIVMPGLSVRDEGAASDQKAGCHSGEICLALMEPRAAADSCLESAVLSSEYNNVGKASVKRQKLSPDGDDVKDEETFESIVIAISQAIGLLETESEKIVSVSCGPADEIVSIFAMLRALWPFLDSLTESDWETVLPMRQRSKKIRHNIASSRSTLVRNAETVSEQEIIGLQRLCLGKFARAYLECVLEMCSLTRDPSLLLTTEKACRPISKILACVRAESSRLDEYFPGSLMLNAAFDSFFAKCLGCRSVPESLRAVVGELCSQNDKLF